MTIKDMDLEQLKIARNKLKRKIDNIYNSLKLNNKTIDDLSLRDQIALLRGLEATKELGRLIKIKGEK